MESYEELKAQIKVIQQRIIETKKNKFNYTLKEIKSFCKERLLKSLKSKGSLPEGINKNIFFII